MADTSPRTDASTDEDTDHPDLGVYFLTYVL